MAAVSPDALAATPAPKATSRPIRFPALGGLALGGFSIAYVSVVVLLPIAALLWAVHDMGFDAMWSALTFPATWSAFTLTLGLTSIAVILNTVFGTIVAWVLVRDEFHGKSIVNSIVDLPFALPTIVAGLTILLLYGSPFSPVHVNVSGTRTIIALALLFVTVPFVIRAVQPVLIAMDRDMEEAGAVLGAGKFTIFRRIILPNVAPALLSGAGLAFARAVGEFGSVVLVSSNLAGKTQIMSQVIFGDIQQIPTYPQYKAIAAALSVILLTVSLALLILFNVISHLVGRPEDA